MPIYEYRCLSCDATFELRQKFSDEPVATHEGCGGKGQRLLSAPQFHFKGSGFYITDYGKDGKGAAKPDSSKPKAEAKTEAKAESKPATPSPAPAAKTD